MIFGMENIFNKKQVKDERVPGTSAEELMKTAEEAKALRNRTAADRLMDTVDDTKAMLADREKEGKVVEMSQGDDEDMQKTG